MSGITFASIAVLCAGTIVACYYLESRRRRVLQLETEAEAEYNILMKSILMCNDTFTYWDIDLDIELYERKFQKAIPPGILFQYVGRLRQVMKSKSHLRILQ